MDPLDCFTVRQIYYRKKRGHVEQSMDPPEEVIRMTRKIYFHFDQQ